MSWQRLEQEIDQVRSEQETLRLHYDRLYSLNAEAIQRNTVELGRLAELVEGRRPFPPVRVVDFREADTPPEMPALSWHQSLRRKTVPLSRAGLVSAVLVALVELVRAIVAAIADGSITLHH